MRVREGKKRMGTSGKGGGRMFGAGCHHVGCVVPIHALCCCPVYCSHCDHLIGFSESS